MSTASAIPAVMPGEQRALHERPADDEARRTRRWTGNPGRSFADEVPLAITTSRTSGSRKAGIEELRAAELHAQRAARQRPDDAHRPHRGARVQCGLAHGAGATSASDSAAVCPVTARNTSSSVGSSTSTASTSMPASSSARTTGAIARAPSGRAQHQAAAVALGAVAVRGDDRHRLGAPRGVDQLDVQMRVADALLEVVRRALGDDVPAVDDADAVGELLGLLEVLRREEDRRAVVVEQPHLAPERGAARRVQARRRLVEEQDPGPVHERHREVQAPAHAAGVRPEPPVAGVDELDAREQVVPALARLGAAQAVERALQAQQLAAGHQRVERGLLERDADRPADLRGLRDDVEAGDDRAPGRRAQQRREDPHRRRLARAVGAEEPVDLAGRDLRGSRRRRRSGRPDTCVRDPRPGPRCRRRASPRTLARRRPRPRSRR